MLLCCIDVVTAIPKSAPSSDIENYNPISITSILSKVYEKLLSHKLSSFCEICIFFIAVQFAYRKGLGCTDVLLTISLPSEVHKIEGWSQILFSSTLLRPSIE